MNQKTVHKSGNIVVNMPLYVKITDLDDQIEKTEIIVESIIIIEPLLYYDKLAFEIKKISIDSYTSTAYVNEE